MTAKGWMDCGKYVTYKLRTFTGHPAQDSRRLNSTLGDHRWISEHCDPPGPLIRWRCPEGKSEVMRTIIFDTPEQLGLAAAHAARHTLAETIARQGQARFIAATGASQFEFLKGLTAKDSVDMPRVGQSPPTVDWSRVEMFHLDEYVGLPMTHPASFRKYLRERLIQPTGLTNFHLLDGEGDVPSVCREVGDALNRAPVDVAFVGIGENGHLAFNDPPADFETDEAYLVVRLDEACRRQQVGEGWFKELAQVPTHAISMSIRQILKARKILCIVPDRRKARAVQECLEGPVSRHSPASILQTHPDVTVFLDKASASLLRRQESPAHAD